MTNVMVTSIGTGGSGGEDRLTENVTLNFAEVKVEYKPQNSTYMWVAWPTGRSGASHRRRRIKSPIRTIGKLSHGKEEAGRFVF